MSDKTALYSESIPVTRNEVTLNAEWTYFKRGERKKAGEKYPEIPVSEENWDTIFGWYGKDNVVACIKADLAIASQKISDTVSKELEKLGEVVGSASWVKTFRNLYSKYMGQLTTRGESIAAMKAMKEKLLEEWAEICLQFSKDPTRADLLSRVQALAKQKDSLDLAIESKSRTGSKEDEEEDAEATPAPVV